jgi:hypothetical protein
MERARGFRPCALRAFEAVLDSLFPTWGNEINSDQLPRAEKAIAGVAEAGQDVSLRVELTVE